MINTSMVVLGCIFICPPFLTDRRRIVGWLANVWATGKAQLLSRIRTSHMTAAQSAAARKNIKKAAAIAKKKRTVAHLPKATRTALGKEGAKAAKKKRAARRKMMDQKHRNRFPSLVRSPR